MSISARTLMIVLRRLFYSTQRNEATPVQRRTASIFIRHLDAGSSGDNEIEVTALFNPIYNIEQYGRRLVASPRHADVALISLPLTRNMLRPVELSLQAMPSPIKVVSLGDEGGNASVFAGSYAVVPLPEAVRGKRIAHIESKSSTDESMFPPRAADILRELVEL